MKCRCRKVSRTVNIEKYVREDYDYENEDDILDICDMYSDNININTSVAASAESLKS